MIGAMAAPELSLVHSGTFGTWAVAKGGCGRRTRTTVSPVCLCCSSPESPNHPKSLGALQGCRGPGAAWLPDGFCPSAQPGRSGGVGWQVCWEQARWAGAASTVPSLSFLQTKIDAARLRAPGSAPGSAPGAVVCLLLLLTGRRRSTMARHRASRRGQSSANMATPRLHGANLVRSRLLVMALPQRLLLPYLAQPPWRGERAGMGSARQQFGEGCWWFGEGWWLLAALRGVTAWGLWALQQRMSQNFSAAQGCVCAAAPGGLLPMPHGLCRCLGAISALLPC